ncbi:Peroxiredoxin-1 [Chionoecetes opilio]|uniref:thioredoxin-dependent peroxiredoxin n=1 Tax=Chionoecetes opilio TaxID=41210 RepID=A0A8J8WDQ3_CHIOP|nr:Peroxiredoxin-1 [Chionoecetes opilio]
MRGLFIIDNKGVLRQITMNDLPVGRSVDETLRLVQAFQFTDDHGEVCPAGWKPGDDTYWREPFRLDRLAPTAIPCIRVTSITLGHLEVLHGLGRAHGSGPHTTHHEPCDKEAERQEEGKSHHAHQEGSCSFSALCTCSSRQLKSRVVSR